MSALGARVVQRLVESAGHEAVLMDFPHAVRKPAPVARPEALSYLDPFIIDETGPVSFFTGCKRLGPEPSQCARMIAEIQPDLLLISCFAYAYAEDTASLARAVHAVAPRLSIVAGGPGPTALPEKFLRTGPISFVLAGEAETNLPQFLAQFSKGDPDYSVVPGFFTLEGGRMFLTKPRRDTTEDELKWVGAISKEKRGDRGGRRLTTSLSRGCPRSCAFCSNHLCHG
ncbi:MAG: cobalamin-dependent protein, partial [Spirochaetales bacterium]|nr:cobalamin-dependent protein [Spirochaetales bacterium]